ncbi:MAG TPA: bifunctional oligoribonuclease/PAP phosphatase NrnA [Terracidiphilus sp.]|jgi:phosphoesterase RecJ-like protein|nr:bifunctional oligoribonuclease/PAP phosphatase NrnA [Terracidiphilus sp.]
MQRPRRQHAATVAAPGALPGARPDVTQPHNGKNRLTVSAQDRAVKAILAAILAGERFLVCSHSRPDGDAVGSVLAMGMILDQLGKHADLFTADRIPAIYRTLPGADRIQAAHRVHGIYDAAILLECDDFARTRLLGLDQYQVINIDHHTSGRDWGALNWIDRDAASAGEMVYRLARTAGVHVSPQMATCLYTTVLTDTGGFCYGGTRASTFALAQELVEAGADPIRIAQDVYFSTAPSKLMLLGAALTHLHLESGLAWLWVTNGDMEHAGATEEDCEGIVNYALSIAGVETAVFLRELPDGRTRLSLRGKGRIDVAAIAARLGGGGHENAAGCTLDGPLPRATEEILTHLRAALARIRR